MKIIIALEIELLQCFWYCMFGFYLVINGLQKMSFSSTNLNKTWTWHEAT